MKPYLFPLASAMAVAALLSTPAIAAPALPASAPIFTNTDHPNLAPLEGALGQAGDVQSNAASPTGAIKNMAPVRGLPSKAELDTYKAGDSASGLTVPGAASGSSLGSGSNSTLAPVARPDESEPQPD